jgi:transcriptional regulator with XRE-family HTH domain
LFLSATAIKLLPKQGNDVTTTNLAKMLATLRETKGVSLRELQTATGISNAYLSQLEQGKAEKPAPDKLEAIARFYEVPYMELMRAAGYVGGAGTPRDPSAAELALMGANLSAEELDLVTKYIQFLRFQKK